VAAILAFILQQETYEPVLLEKRAVALRASTGNPRYQSRTASDTSVKDKFWVATTRPLAMLLKSPIVLLTSIYVGLVYGYLYLLFTSFEGLFSSIYHLSTGVVGLTYLGFGVGCMVGLVIFGATSDRLVAFYARNKPWKPEYRLPPLIPGSLLIPIGLFWYGWSAQAHLHWIMPIVGSGWVGMGILATFMPIQAYLLDAFPLYAASAAAANNLFRSLIGAFLPLAGPSMYAALGQGWGNSLLAFIALVFLPIAFALYTHGEKIRTSFPVEF
jgi:MFS family permease